MPSLADYMSGIQPGINLPFDVQGSTPTSFSDVLSQITGPQQFAQQSPVQQTPAPAPQTPPGDMSLAGDPGTLSNRIQQWLGAKQPDAGGQVQDILAGRFQQPFNFNDVGTAAQATAASGQFVPAQQIANQRFSGNIDLASKLADMQEKQAQANLYGAMANNGGGRGEGLAAAMHMMAEYNADPDVISGKKSPLSFTNAYMMATAKQGQGVTFDQNGNQTVFNGAPQAAGSMAGGKTQGQKDVELNMNPQIEGATQTSKNTANIAAAAPEAAQKEIGKARGEAQVNLATLQSGLPQLNAVVSDLDTLGKVATYTKGGQLYNDALRQLNLPMSAGGDARAEYVSRVDNVLLPSLKAIFGARITNYDLAAARSMMVNPDLSPTEKTAQLRAFIDQRNMSVQSDAGLVSRLGGNALGGNQSSTQGITPSGGVVHFNDLPP